MKKIVLGLVAGLVLIGSNVFAADGDLIVNGKVGIGTTTSPGAKLHVAGNDSALEVSIGDDIWTLNDATVRMTMGNSDGASVLRMGQSSTAYGFLAWGYNATEANSYLKIQSNPLTNRGVAIQPDGGNVGIGNTNPTFLLTMEAQGGGFYDATNGEQQGWHDSSSVRWKSDIKPIRNALDTVLKLNGVSFKWKKRTDIFETIREGDQETQKYISSTWEDNPNAKDTIGLIGEDVVKVLPQVVAVDQKDSNFAAGIAYSKIVALLIEAVKEQQKAIADLQAEVQKLQGK
jgi:hypothetical protein